MLDIKFIRENPELVKENIKKKFQDSKLPLVDEVLALDPGCKHEYTKGYCPFCEKSLLLGDANSDGRVNMGDVASLYAHVRYTKQITDADQLRCANVTGGIINLADVARLFAHITGRNKLY